MLGRRMIVLAVSLFSLAQWGCNSSGSGGDQTTGPLPTTAYDPATDTYVALGTDATGTTFKGTLACVTCHQDSTDSAEKVRQYLQGKHVIHSAEVNAGIAAACLVCHDPVNDSKLTQTALRDFLAANPAIAAANPNAIPAQGLAAIGCEACHGAGGDHFGGDMPEANARPSYTVCGKCHDATMPHQTDNPFGGSILENYNLSGHKRSLDHADDQLNTAFCSRCHSDEGFRAYAIDANTLGQDKDALHASLDGEPALTSVSPVQCRTCHDPHSGALRTKATTQTTPGGDKVAFSASFNLCTTCHMVFLNATWDAAAQRFTYLLNPAKVLQHVETGWSASHFAAVNGYKINAADDKACLNCHDAHGASKFGAGTAAIATGWAQQAGFHGDYLKKPFTFDFAGEETTCMRCHNGTEAVKALLGGAATGLDASQGGRVVACVTCHDLTAKDATGAFALGPRRTMPANFTFPSGKTVAGVGDNALCLTCHSGPDSMAAVDAAIVAAPGGPHSFASLHYVGAGATPGATLFGNMAQGAYEFPGTTADPKYYASKFEHVEGMDLCIDCHDKHTGRVKIGTCRTCHTTILTVPDGSQANYDLALNEVRAIRMAGSIADYDNNGTKAGIYAEVEGLKGQLLAAILVYAPTLPAGEAIVYNGTTYPYFFKADGTTPYTGMDDALFKAAYNYHFAQQDPGAYAHNASYIIEILYDSIEALDPATAAVLTRDDSGHFNAADLPFRDWDGDAQVNLSCARCHSSEGAAYFLANNNTPIPAYQRQYTMGKSSGLACETCHVAPFGGAPGSPTAPDRRQQTAVPFPSGVVLSDTAPNVDFFANDSNLCMTCHQGRASKNAVDQKIAAGPTNGTYSFTNIHYFAAAATFFGHEVQGGYEYPANIYADRLAFFTHSFAGLNTCVGCHMQSGAPGDPTHDFMPAVDNCNGCHVPLPPAPGRSDFSRLSEAFAIPGSSLAGKYDDIQTLKGILLQRLEDTGVTRVLNDRGEHVYPYFTNITTPNQLKAAYNWQVADKEPCGYIHNSVYITQLLYDSIVDMGGVLPVGFVRP